MVSTRDNSAEDSGDQVRTQSEQDAPFEVAAKAGWEHRRAKWTQPEWGRLPLETRLVIVAKTKAAIAAFSADAHVLLEALQKIARGEVEVLDDEFGTYVTVPMSAEEAGEIAHAAIEKSTGAKS